MLFSRPVHRHSTNPLISINLPLAADASSVLLEGCLRSISNQTFTDFETLILVSNGAPDKLRRIAHDFPDGIVFEGTYSKSSARNKLLKHSSGEFVVYLDVDNVLPPTMLDRCANAAAGTGSRALIAPNKEAPSSNFWRRCRSLEWELLAGDLYAETPNFVGRDLLEKLGGFDPQLDPLDDWGLNLALRARNIQFDRADTCIFVHSNSNLREIVRLKFLRGQRIRALKEKYPNVPQVRFARRFVNGYLRNWRLLAAAPNVAFGLAFLKVLDLSAITLGRLWTFANGSARASSSYLDPGVAKEYDSIRIGDNFNSFKHFSEVGTVIELMPKSPKAVIEVGCGTGRMTDLLVKAGHSLFPVDPSPAMLSEYAEKSGLPAPVNADGMHLPFSADSFDGAISIRVIWHMPSSAALVRFFGEMARVSSNFIMLDITNQQRWKNPLIRAFKTIYFAVRPDELQVHDSSQLMSLSDFALIANNLGFATELSVPLDVLSPFWLNIFPTNLARSLYPFVRRLEMGLSRFIPPGRYLVFLSKSPLGLEHSDIMGPES